MNAGEPRRGAELDAGDSGRGGAQHGELRRDQPAGQVSHVPRVTCLVCNVVTCNRVMLTRVTCVMLSRGRNTETWIEKAQNFFEGKQVY